MNKRKLLIVIDMQNDFIDGALGTGEAVGIVEAVKEKIRSYPAADVIATMDTHSENYMDTQEGKYLPVPHCIRGSDGWKIRAEIEDLLKGARIFEKPTFGSMQLAEELKTLTEREEKVLKLRFGLEDGRGRTLEEVGKLFDVTRERIRQIEAKALRKLRHPSRSKKLKDYLE